MARYLLADMPQWLVAYNIICRYVTGVIRKYTTGHICTEVPRTCLLPDMPQCLLLVHGICVQIADMPVGRHASLAGNIFANMSPQLMPG